MKFTVYYLDDPEHPQTIEANTAEMAAWRFVRQRPRADASQLTVESRPAVSWHVHRLTHHRACDLVGQPAPADEPEPDLVVRLTAGPEPCYVVSGSAESLRLLGERLLRALAERPAQPTGRHVCGFAVVAGSGSRLGHGLTFEVDADIAQHWARRTGLHGWWVEHGRLAAGLLLFALACFGAWTLFERFL